MQEITRQLTEEQRAAAEEMRQANEEMQQITEEIKATAEAVWEATLETLRACTDMGQAFSERPKTMQK